MQRISVREASKKEQETYVGGVLDEAGVLSECADKGAPHSHKTPNATSPEKC